ncbi:BnaAnng27990D, partial [Brassica napus]
MAKPRLLRPQFFHALVPGFHTHLVNHLSYSLALSRTASLFTVHSYFRLASQKQESEDEKSRSRSRTTFFFFSDNSCFVALVTASSLRTDKLYLPQHVTSSNGLTRKCCKIVLVDGGERSWTLDLSFNKSSDTFCMSRGWRNFCEENGQEPGGFFMFKLVGNGETPSLPALFVRENGINKPGEVHLLGKDGTKWPTSLLVNIRGSMSLGKGWKEFIKANGVESGFTIKFMWEDTTPVFSLCSADSTSEREQEEYFKGIKKQSLFIDPSNIDNSSKDENNKEENMSWEGQKRGR